MNTKKIAGTPTRISTNELMLASAQGDAAADNILDMVDHGECKRDDEARFAELYNATCTDE